MKTTVATLSRNSHRRPFASDTLIKNSCRVVILSEAKDLLFDKSTTKQILRRSLRRPSQNDVVEKFFMIPQKTWDQALRTQGERINLEGPA